MFLVRQTAIIGFAAFILGACEPKAPSSGAAEAPTTIDRMNDPVVARVNGTPIHRSDVRRAAEAQGLISTNAALTMDDPIFRVTIDEMIDQRLLSLDAVRTGIAKKPEVQRRLAAARERVLGNYRVEHNVADAVNDTTIRELYAAQRDLAGRGEERRARQIVVADEATALEVAGRLDDEEDFRTLAAEFSTDAATRDRGGELGWVSRDMLTGAVRSAVFETPAGQRAAPVSAQDGWHIIEVIDMRTPSSRSFEETRDEIARFMTFEAGEELVTELRERGDIERLYETMDAALAPTAASSPDNTDTDNE
jgi:peptidyl-prolyl cis-trans isomerase C